MGKTVFGGGTSNCTNIFNSGTTVYRLIGSGDSRGTETSTEANRKVSPTLAATASNLWMYSSVNAHTAALTFNSRNNSANGNLSISVTALTTGAFSDDTHSDSAANNTVYDIAQTIGASDAFHNYTCTQWSLLWDTGASNPANIICSVSDEGSQGASTTSYNQFVGGGSNSPGYFGHTTEDGQVQMNIRNSSCSFRRLQTFISSSTSSNAGTMNFRTSATNGSNTLSITAATTGRFTDSLDIDSGLGGTGLINWSWITGSGTSNAVIEYAAGQLLSPGGSTAWDMFAGQGYTGAGSAVSTSSDSYLNILGCFTQSFTTTEANAQTRIPIISKFSNLRLYLASAGAGGQTMTFRKGGADQTQSISVTASTTGLFEDSSHTDTISANDLVNAKLTHPSSGTCVPSRVGVLADSTVTNTYNDSVTETMTAADTVSTTATFIASDTEAMTAADTVDSANNTYVGSVTEAMTALVVVDAAGSEGVSVSESMTGSDTSSAALVTSGSVTESMTAADTVSAGTATSSAVTESMTAAVAVDAIVVPFNHSGEAVVITL